MFNGALIQLTCTFAIIDAITEAVEFSTSLDLVVGQNVTIECKIIYFIPLPVPYIFFSNTMLPPLLVYNFHGTEYQSKSHLPLEFESKTSLSLVNSFQPLRIAKGFSDLIEIDSCKMRRLVVSS